MKMFVWLFIAVVVLIVVFGVSVFNKLVRARNQAKMALRKSMCSSSAVTI